MIRLVRAALVILAAVIVTVGVSRWRRKRKADRQWAEAVAALVRAREDRLREAVHFAAWQAEVDADRSEP